MKENFLPAKFIKQSSLIFSFTIAITLLMLTALATELPPNFKTCISFIYVNDVKL